MSMYNVYCMHNTTNYGRKAVLISFYNLFTMQLEFEVSMRFNEIELVFIVHS